MSPVHCEWCHSETHNEVVCAYKHMPCTHCGVVGHYKGRLSRCPKWRSRPAATETAAAVVGEGEVEADKEMRE